MVPWKSAAFEELRRFFPEFLPGIGLYILTVEGNDSGGCVVETGDQIHKSGFTASGTADDSDRRAVFLRKK